MKDNWPIKTFGIVEISIGVITLTTVAFSLIQGTSAKPPGVLVFVLTTAITSASLGLGILKYSLRGYYLLLYFSSIIILSKILIFGGIITLNGALETAVPSNIKNAISILYHGLVIFYFTRKSIKKYFIRS